VCVRVSMYICMYVFMYVCMYVCVSVYMYGLWEVQTHYYKTLHKLK